MKIRNKFFAASMAALLSTGAVAAYASADAASGKAANYQTQPGMLQTADEALAAVIQAHAARVDLMNNRIDDAKAKLKEAATAFSKSETDWKKFQVKDTKNPGSDAKYLPIDVSMGLSETFTDTKENKAALQKAYGMMQSGSKDQALDVLRAAAVDVNMTAALLPMQDTGAQLAKARSLIDQGKYFEANLALKAIEDSVVVQSYALNAIPQQGNIE